MKLPLATAVLSSTPPPAPTLCVLRVDRVFDASEQPRLPNDDLPDTSYVPTPAIDRWEVTIDGEQVTLVTEALRLEGRETSNVFGERRFEITSGAPKGGRFVVHGVDAELTLFGGNEPVASSERGKLVPRP
ncbi:MAG: hypothetical protein KIT84_08535 [Labilithrix sp.]|nr:hypothetical protein [Labilithrix sp.]MCW5811045.1 hypothetical protein [Labilithrix sp.]